VRLMLSIDKAVDDRGALAPREGTRHLYFAHIVSVNGSIVNAHDALISPASSSRGAFATTRGAKLCSLRATQAGASSR
jgi:hypothetical protein